jgi:hypothetical protein
MFWQSASLKRYFNLAYFDISSTDADTKHLYRQVFSGMAQLAFGL